MTKRALPRVVLYFLAAMTMGFPAATSAFGQPPGPPGSGAGLPWQVGALFTANWVLAAIAVTILSRPSKRPEKPKKSQQEEAE